MGTPALAVTLGDPRGIGPEVVDRAVPLLLERQPNCRCILLGPDELRPLTLPPGTRYQPVGSWDGSQRSAGRLSAEALRQGVHLALQGSVRALVTGPVHKPALHDAGWYVPGQTEMLQQLTESPQVGMLMVAERTVLGGPLRILLATTHARLRDVPVLLTDELLESQTRLLVSALRWGWGIGAPRVALCALNPHASDGGLFGDEEDRVYQPAMRRLRESGLAVEGPLPADTVFRRALEGSFDAVVAPYHDVGMAAFKTSTFGEGVNVSLGLPFVRTSPDHGTAFDLAGRGRASHASMLEALRMAVRLSERPRAEAREPTGSP